MQQQIFTGLGRRFRLKPKCPKCNSKLLWAKHLELRSRCDKDKILKGGLL